MRTREEISQDLVNLGFTQDRLTEVLNLAAIAVADQVSQEFVVKATDEEAAKQEAALNNADTEEKKAQVVKDMATFLYASSADEKLEEIALDFLEYVIDQTKNVKKIADGYTTGDTSTVQKVNEVKNSEEGKKLIEEYEAYIKSRQNQ